MNENQNIRVENKPGKPWLIFLHGFCECSTMWADTLGSFAGDFNYLTPDLPGFGLASSERINSMEKMAYWVSQKVKERTDGPVHLIGHSMGGYIALEIYKMSPNLTKSISLVHSTASSDDESKKANRDKGIEFIKHHGLKPYLKEFKKNLLGHPNQPDHIQQKIEEIVQKGAIDSEGVIQALTAMKNRTDKTELLASRRVPAHYFIGKGDAFLPYRKLQIEALQAKNSSVSFMEDSTHIGFLEQPKLFQRELMAFILRSEATYVPPE